MSGQTAAIDRLPISASAAGAPVQALGELPPRRTLEALFQSVDKRLPAERALRIIAVGTTILAVIGVGFILQVARPIMLPLAAAIVVSILLTPAADWLGRRGVPEAPRAGVVIAAALVALFAAIYFVGRPGVAWLETLPEVVEQAREKLGGLAAAVTQVQEQVQEVSQQVEEIASGPEQPGQPDEVVIRRPSLTGSIIKSARTALIQAVFAAVLVYFFLSTRSGFRQKAMAARPTMRGKLQVARIFRDIQRKVGAYMFTMLLINTGLGLAVAGALMAIDMPSPIVWGFLAGLLNFVPYLGPTIVTLLLAISGVVTYDQLAMALVPPAIYMALNFVESNLVTPSLIGVRLKISPLAVIVSIAFLTWMWGPVGAVIAIPLIVVLKTVCDGVPALQPVGVFIGEVEMVRGRKLGFCRVQLVGRAR